MKKLTTNQFIQKANMIHSGRYSYDKTEYTLSQKKVVITCCIHGDFLQRPNDHLSGNNGCPHCKVDKISALKRKDLLDVLDEFRTVHGNQYQYDSVTYVNTHTPVTITCTLHGPFSLSPSKHLLGRGCPNCGASNGERVIAETLKSMGLHFIMQHQFDDLTGDYRPLKFDFFIPDLNILIEYDGEFHFFHHKIFNYKYMSDDEAITKFLKLKEYDALKNSYAIFNKLYLLRIPYFVSTPKKIKKLISDFISYSKLKLPEIDDRFSYVEIQVIPRLQSRE